MIRLLPPRSSAPRNDMKGRNRNWGDQPFQPVIGHFSAALSAAGGQTVT
jgi:hypothetical protein